MNSPVCPKIDLAQDFTVVLIPCKSDEDLIKNEIAVVRATLS